MTMRRWLPHLVALALGAGAALLGACADGGPKGGVTANAAQSLKSQLEYVRVTVDSAKCDRLSRELRQVIDRVDGLPSSVDAQLRQRLSDGYARLKTQALKDCNDNRDKQQTQTTTTDTQTNTAPTQTSTATTPATTPTTPTTSTATTPTTSVPTTPTPPPVTPPQPAPAGGGTPPHIP